MNTHLHAQESGFEWKGRVDAKGDVNCQEKLLIYDWKCNAPQTSISILQNPLRNHHSGIDPENTLEQVKIDAEPAINA